jgi:hypothetical protein
LSGPEHLLDLQTETLIISTEAASESGILQKISEELGVHESRCMEILNNLRKNNLIFEAPLLLDKDKGTANHVTDREVKCVS